MVTYVKKKTYIINVLYTECTHTQIFPEANKINVLTLEVSIVWRRTDWPIK